VNAMRTVTVTVTGARPRSVALLPRIAQRNMLGEDTWWSCGYSNPQGCRHGGRGHGAWEDSAFPLVAAWRSRTTPTSRSPAQHRAAGGRPPPARAWSARAAGGNGAIFTVQGKALSENAADDVRSSWWAIRRTRTAESR